MDLEGVQSGGSSPSLFLSPLVIRKLPDSVHPQEPRLLGCGLPRPVCLQAEKTEERGEGGFTSTPWHTGVMHRAFSVVVFHGRSACEHGGERWWGLHVHTLAHRVMPYASAQSGAYTLYQRAINAVVKASKVFLRQSRC